MTIETEREDVVHVSPRNGAWFIQFQGSIAHTGDATPDELFDCASSLVRAKRVARDGAEDMGYQGPWRWSGKNGAWTLEATYVMEYGYTDDDEGAAII